MLQNILPAKSVYNIVEFCKQSHNVYKFTLFLNTIKSGNAGDTHNKIGSSYVLQNNI